MKKHVVFAMLAGLLLLSSCQLVTRLAEDARTALTHPSGTQPSPPLLEVGTSAKGLPGASSKSRCAATYHTQFPPSFPIDPTYPDMCGDGAPVDCSTPWFLDFVSPNMMLYDTVFHDACVQHDYCYRHGYATYGMSRSDCDAELRDNMHAICDEAEEGFWGWVASLLFGCHPSAEEYYAGVRTTGGAYFRTDDSTCCEYDERPATTATCGTVAYAPVLSFGDFDGDGKADVFRGDGSAWYVCYGGMGSWQKLNTSSLTPRELAFGDFDGDARTDVFRGNGSDWYVSYSGTGSWEHLNRSQHEPKELAFGDFDGDGKTDVFRGDGSDWYVSYGGTGSWTKLNHSELKPHQLAFGDFNGDGKTDVFRGDGSDWYVSYGGTGSWETLNHSSLKVHQLAFADFDCNGRTDVFRADGEHFYISYGGVTSWQEANDSAVTLRSLGFSDLNGDKRADAFYANGEHWFVSDKATAQWEQINTSSLRVWDIEFP